MIIYAEREREIIDVLILLICNPSLAENKVPKSSG